MLLGSSLAGQAFANAPVAAIHALAYPLGGHFHIPHGLSNALVLLPVLRVNSVVASTEYSELLDCLPNTGPHRGTEVERAETFIQKLDDLIDQVGIPRRLSKLNINEQDLPILAKDAMLQQRLLINNPVEITEARALDIYQSVF
jgi:alcohol dehydrogenase